ncbi:MAG: chromosomal replication initiator protein DnaA [Acidimicrobiia bacterium]|nr:chromosomal replication initiator protein DnaA [Acidimicrobiia bacterium]
MNSGAGDLWSDCVSKVRGQVSEAVLRMIFDQVDPVDYDGDILLLGVPNTLLKDRVERRYRPLIDDALRELGCPGVQVIVQVKLAGPRHEDGELVPPPPRGEGPRPSRPHEDGERPASRGKSNGSPLSGGAPVGGNMRYTFDAFVTGASNRFAHAAALSVAETPARSYNPLFIYGDAGLGKTHLLQAISHYVAENYPSFKVRYVSTETFLNEFVDAIRQNTTQDFKRRYREIDVLLVDDIQFMGGKEGLQEEFFHTFNHLHGSSRQIVLSSDRPPDSIPTLEDRLRSRFKMGLITDIQPPDLETRLAILRKKAEGATVPIPDDVMDFIASNITNNIRELEGALTRVVAFSSLNREVLSRELAEQVLADTLRESRPRPITPKLILDTTCERFTFSVEDLIGKSRRRPLVQARQVAMYVMRELTDLSYPAIAREFGGRDHTTVIHAVEKIGTLMKERRQIYDQVTAMIAEIKSGGPT